MSSSTLPPFMFSYPPSSIPSHGSSLMSAECMQQVPVAGPESPSQDEAMVRQLAILFNNSVSTIPPQQTGVRALSPVTTMGWVPSTDLGFNMTPAAMEETFPALPVSASPSSSAFQIDMMSQMSPFQQPHMPINTTMPFSLSLMSPSFLTPALTSAPLLSAFEGATYDAQMPSLGMASIIPSSCNSMASPLSQPIARARSCSMPLALPSLTIPEPPQPSYATLQQAQTPRRRSDSASVIMQTTPIDSAASMAGPRRFSYADITTPILPSHFGLQALDINNQLFDINNPGKLRTILPKDLPVSLSPPAPATPVRRRRKSLELPCPFEGCNRTFPRRYNLRSHLLCHSTEKPNVCGTCGASFARKHDLSRHMRTLHNKRREFACCVCDQRFVNASQMVRHMLLEKGHGVLRKSEMDGAGCEKIFVAPDTGVASVAPAGDVGSSGAGIGASSAVGNVAGASKTGASETEGEGETEGEEEEMEEVEEMESLEQQLANGGFAM
ncbi:Metallothionein expression activator [Phlyctochytrium planicorne]|nr:Metallothionein expression activator [Phlyctochytrium planicorne]